jgi:excisionase family DNA binding protein
LSKNLTTTEAAKLLGVCRSRINRLIETGRLPATKFGTAWLVDSATLEAFSRQKRVNGRPKKDLKRNEIKAEKNN